MKKTLAVLVAVLSAPAFASSYVTGNLQSHSDFEPSVTSTIEAGHTFDIGTTVYAEIDGINLSSDPAANPFITVGIEQSYDVYNATWLTLGYQHVIYEGDSLEYRPYARITHSIDDLGLTLSHRTRVQIPEDSDLDTEFRLDTSASYTFNEDVSVSYNNIYLTEASYFEHELRATWTRNGVQPYVEYRNQGDNENNAFVVGATLVF
ncbi:porin [Vibrio breoganii]